MDDLLQVAPHIQLFNEVHKEYFSMKALSCENELECEELYRLLYTDIRNHSDIYFDVLFHMNDIYAERCVSILDTLAAILKRKDKEQACLQVLELEGRVLKTYQALSNPPPSGGGKNEERKRRRRSRAPRSANNRAQIKYCRELTYRYNDLRIEMDSQMGNQGTAVEALREACQYEMEEKLTFEQQKWLVVLFPILGPSYEEISKDQLEHIDDDNLWQALLHHCRSSQFSGPTFEVDLRKCHGCERVEHSRGEFEECSKCFKAFYCSYECQLQHWKTHKKECAKSKRPSPRSVFKLFERA